MNVDRKRTSKNGVWVIAWSWVILFGMTRPCFSEKRMVDRAILSA